MVSRRTLGGEPKWSVNVAMSVIVCFLWGYMLYTGNIASLWRMMGIANQLLATIALAVGTTYLLKNAPKRVYALCTAIPLAFVSPWISGGLYILVALMWLVPDRRIERVLAKRE